MSYSYKKYGGIWRSISRRRSLASLVLAICGYSASPALAHSTDRVTVGIGAAVAPAYEGSDDYRLLPFPLLDVQRGHFFVNLNGVGVNVIDTATFQVGGSITYVRGYRRRDVPDGVDRLSDAAGGRLFGSLTLAGIKATVGATRSFAGGTHGITGDVQLSYPVPASDRLTIVPSISASWANSRHMRRYFGISDREAAASGLSSYSPTGGMKNMSANVSAIYRISPKAALIGSFGKARLRDKAADSPIVEQRWQPAVFLGVGYRV